jgi:two-component system alkaline phosphatase synthesis response regulator PhoP
MLPELDGFDVSENIRLQNIETPILMLSARAGSSDRVMGLKKGADDYLTKPFNLEELLLRVEKLIEKNKKLSDRSHVNELLHFGGNTINFKSQKAVNYQGEEVQLSKKEIMLLKLMVEYKNEVVSREKILQAVWGYQVFPTTRTIDNFILNFRKYFEKDPKNPRHFHSIRSVGYRFTI